jgi:hypothetical protein
MLSGSSPTKVRPCSRRRWEFHAERSAAIALKAVRRYALPRSPKGRNTNSSRTAIDIDPERTPAQSGVAGLFHHLGDKTVRDIDE